MVEICHGDLLLLLLHLKVHEYYDGMNVTVILLLLILYIRGVSSVMVVCQSNPYCSCSGISRLVSFVRKICYRNAFSHIPAYQDRGVLW